MVNNKELLKRDIGAELLASVQEMQARKVGKIHHISVPEIVEVRNKSGMS